jgi:creatinine amidohydrolase
VNSHYLADLTTVEATSAFDSGAIVIVPVGATEQHGPHMPLETDWRLCTAMAERAASEVTTDGVRVLITPPVWAGYSPHHMAFAGTISLQPDTFRHVLIDIARSLWTHGARKILLLNGHGGNTNLLRGVAPELHFDAGVRVAVANYWDFALPFIAEWRDSGDGGIDHACELETSLMLAVRGELVQLERVHDHPWKPISEFLSGDLLIGGPVSVSWYVSELSASGVLGSPELASKDKGEKVIAHLVPRLAAFLRDFDRWKWETPTDI